VTFELFAAGRYYDGTLCALIFTVLASGYILNRPVYFRMGTHWDSFGELEIATIKVSSKIADIYREN
jgi:hypothetical protein